MGQPISWSGDYVKDTKDMLSALGTFERMSIMHEDSVNEFYYGSILSEFKDMDYPEKEHTSDGLFEIIEIDENDEVNYSAFRKAFLNFDFITLSKTEKTKIMDKLKKDFKNAKNIYIDDLTDYIYNFWYNHKNTEYAIVIPYYTDPDDREEFEGSLWDLVEQVDNETAKKIAEALREQISNFIWNR